MEQVQISLSLIMGFGWSAQKGPELGPEGSRNFTYRYIPPGCWSPDSNIIRAYLNAAAKVFPTFDLFPPDLLPTPPAQGDEELTPQGRAFYDSCPLYAQLEVLEDRMIWKQYRPDGELAWSTRSNRDDVLFDLVVRDWPINDWAQMFLDPWKKLLHLHAKHGHKAMYMQAALPKDAVPEEDEEGWTRGDLGFPMADIHERVEAPWGLYKVLLWSCEEGRVEGCKKMEFSPEFQLLPCSLAVRATAGAPFIWREHHVWRFETAVQLLPRALKWIEDEGVGHPGAWGARVIAPCYKWDMPEIRWQFKPDEAGWETLGLIYKPLSELDPVALATYEHDFANIPRPPRP